MANVEWSKIMFPPEAEKVQGKPKRDTKVMELFCSPLTKRYEQRRKISSWFYIFFKQRSLQPLSLLEPDQDTGHKMINTSKKLNNMSLAKYFLCSFSIFEKTILQGPHPSAVLLFTASFIQYFILVIICVPIVHKFNFLSTVVSM